MDKSQRRLTKEEMERTIEQVADLIDDSKYRPFFFGKLSSLGIDEFLEMAGEARAESAGFRGRKFASLLKYGRRRKR